MSRMDTPIPPEGRMTSLTPNPQMEELMEIEERPVSFDAFIRSTQAHERVDADRSNEGQNGEQKIESHMDDNEAFKLLFGKTIREVILENTPNQNTPINRKSHEESDDYRVKPSLQPSSKPAFLDTPYAERAHGTEQKKWPDDMSMPPRGKGKGGRSRFQEEANPYQHDDYDNPRGGKGSRWKGFQDDELEGSKGSRIDKYPEDDKMIATFTRLFEKEFKWDGQATTYRQFMLRFEDALE
jgi:hypothetical protein